MFFIKHTELGNSRTALLEIEGPLNSETSPDLEEYLDKLIDNDIVYLLIDSHKISFISSEGIGIVLLLQRKISSRNGMAVFFGLPDEILQLFGLLGFDKVLSIAAERDEALEIIEKKIELDGHTGSITAESPAKDVTGDKNENDDAIPKAAVSLSESHEIKPFVIECIKCSSLVRVSMKGDHYCPYCSAPFTVSGEGNAMFRINNIPVREVEDSES